MAFGILPPSRVCPPTELLLHKLALTHAGSFQATQARPSSPKRREGHELLLHWAVENVGRIAPKFLRHQVKNELDKSGIRNTLHYTVRVYDIE